jgi:hypothetical protein
MKIALVACSASKASADAPVRDLYTGQLFRLSLRYAEATADRVFVLSAKHGLLSLTSRVAPYDVAIVDLTAVARAEWASRVAADLEIALDAQEPESIAVLAGAAYVRPLLPALNERVLHRHARRIDDRILLPLAYRGAIGEQKHWLASEIAKLGAP